MIRDRVRRIRARYGLEPSISSSEPEPAVLDEQLELFPQTTSMQSP